MSVAVVAGSPQRVLETRCLKLRVSLLNTGKNSSERVFRYVQGNSLSSSSSSKFVGGEGCNSCAACGCAFQLSYYVAVKTAV